MQFNMFILTFEIVWQSLLTKFKNEIYVTPKNYSNVFYNLVNLYCLDPSRLFQSILHLKSE